MFLLITPAGGKLWRLKYRIDGRENAIGAYPKIGLGEARRRREEAREMIALGKDPSREKPREKVRRDGAKGWAPATATRSEYLLSLVCGSIGKLPFGETRPADVLTAVRRIEGKGKLESARRRLQLASAVFRYAMATARLVSDPTRDLRGALTAPTVTQYGAITDAKKAGELLRAINDYEGSGITKFALQIPAARPCPAWLGFQRADSRRVSPIVRDCPTALFHPSQFPRHAGASRNVAGPDP